MILVFEPDPPFIRWRATGGRYLSQGRIVFDAACLGKIKEKVLKSSGKEKVVLGYLLPNGGDEIKKPVSLLTGESLAGMGRCIKFLPEHNNIIYKTASHLWKNFGGYRHVLFCDSAFFIDLPENASTYAIPYKLRKTGVRRYGGYGLCHERAWEEARRAFGKGTQKVISVYLGNTPNIAAIKNGIPVETTIGFTAVEGIPSVNACGDIDPTIIFQLYAEGMSFERINNLLSEESGLKCLRNKAPEILRYHIVRYVGAFIAILEGVDAIVFTTDNAWSAKKLIFEICHLLDFLGFKSKMKTRKTNGRAVLSNSRSEIKGLWLRYDKWKIFEEKSARLALKEE